MMDEHSPGWRSDATIRWWLVPLVFVFGLLVVGATSVLIARAVYERSDPDGFSSLLAANVLLNGAVVVTLGAIVTTVLSIASEIRARGDRAAEKRRELFRRMRDAHVRVAMTQQMLRVRRDAAMYDEQMRMLMLMVKDFEEVREEVKVSGRLYADEDRRSVVRGIALIIAYLQEGIAEYAIWCDEPGAMRPRPDAADAWIVHLVADHDANWARCDPTDDDWEPAGHMPATYDNGLELSKLILRAYVYGSRPRKWTSGGRELVEAH